jgi:hypothetical protein
VSEPTEKVEPPNPDETQPTEEAPTAPKEEPVKPKEDQTSATKEFREAMPNLEEQSQKVFMGKFEGKIVDESHYRPATKYTTKEQPT